jgi:hypothetical protein
MTNSLAGAFAAHLPAPRPMIAMLTEAMAELNRTPNTLTDEQQARALSRILAARGIKLEARHVG